MANDYIAFAHTWTELVELLWLKKNWLYIYVCVCILKYRDS